MCCGGAKTMNTYDYTYRRRKKKLTLSVNKDLVSAAKAKNINLSFFLESKLLELLNTEIKTCGGWDLNPRIPAEQDLKLFRELLFGNGGFREELEITEEEVELYLKFKKTTTTDPYVKRCRKCVVSYLQALEWEISYERTLDYFSKIKGSKYSAKTYRDNVLLVRDFLRFRNVPWSSNIKLPRYTLPLPKIVKVEQINKFLREVEKNENPKKQILKSFTILGICTGMRAHELYSLTKEQIDLQTRSISLHKTKTGVPRVVFFNEEAKNELEKLLEMQIDPVFPERIVQRFYVSKKNKMGGLLAKHLRKYFSSMSDKLGMPTGVKKRLMGHSTSGDVDLQHYSALTFDELKEIYDKYWGEVRIGGQ